MFKPKNISECFAKLCSVVIVAMFVVTTALIPLMIFLFTFMCSLCCKSILHHKKLNCQKTIFCHTCFSCLTEKTANRCFWNIRIIVTTVFRIHSFNIFMISKVVRDYHLNLLNLCKICGNNLIFIMHSRVTYRILGVLSTDIVVEHKCLLLFVYYVCSNLSINIIQL